MNRLVRSAAAGVALCLSLAMTGCASPRDQRSATQAARGLVHDTAVAVETIVDDGERPELRTALHGACAALVFPHMRGGGFFAGWSSGGGVLMVRDPGSAQWVGPAFLTLGDMTIGPEVAMSTWELVVVFERCDALRPLREGSSTFSFRTSFARQSAEDDAGVQVKPGIRAFARTEGVAVGVSLHFVELQADAALTTGCYGHALTPDQALAPGVAGNDNVAALRRAMERATR